MESAACMAALPGAAAQPTCMQHTRAGAYKVGNSDYVVASPVHICSNQCTSPKILAVTQHTGKIVVSTVISDYDRTQQR